jgi:hypothetical protein
MYGCMDVPYQAAFHYYCCSVVMTCGHIIKGQGIHKVGTCLASLCTVHPQARDDACVRLTKVSCTYSHMHVLFYVPSTLLTHVCVVL